ncbi:MAG TPA: FtsX-like permease family protein [Ardenticatenaceae bacterium]|jgi:putative ABC transport system permease protein
MSLSLFKLGQRYLLRRPLQSILVVLGIALGVAVVIAIDLANGSASRAFSLSTEAISGRATHQIVGGPNGVPQEIYGQLRRELGLREVAPIVSDYVTVRELGDQPVRLLGIDPFSEAPFRSYLGSADDEPLSLEALTAFLAQPNTIFLSREVAEQNGLESGNTLTLGIGPREVTATIAGLLDPSNELSRRALDSLLLADISTAQELLQRDTLSNIDLILPEGEAGTAEVERIASILPEGVRVEQPATRTATIQQLSAAFELNLTALSLLALVVGMFLIYNTVTFSVVQRRPVLGTLRALGVTREEIFALILGEAAVMGVVGALFGMGLGIVLGRGVVGLVTQTINDLYFVVNVAGVDVAPTTLLKGSLIGILSALLAAAVPAWEAASVEPVTALRRSAIESRVMGLLPKLSLAGAGLGLVGLVLLAVSTRSVVVSFLGLFAVIIAFALLTPWVTVLFMRLAESPLARLGVLGRMAPRDIVRALSRTSVAIAALMVAVSVIIGVSVMIGSFRNTVTEWLETTLQADIYISPPNIAANRSTAPMERAIAEQVASFEGVERISWARDVTVASPEFGRVQLVAVSEEVSGRQRPFKWVEGSQEAAWERAQLEGAVFVSEPFAFRHEIGQGDSVTLYTDMGERSFPVVGVYYDYSSDQGVVLMPDALYRTLYDDPYLSSVAAFVTEGTDPDALVGQLRTFFAGEQALVIRSNVGLRASVLEVFERAFAITGALQLLATIVAFIGVLSALMAMQLERARELGTLRATGMTQRQLWGLTMLETGLMGSTAGLWAMPTGLALALVLIYVINRRSFGWTLQLHLEPSALVEAFAVALVAALLAGIYPAVRMSRIRISEAIRSE